MASNTFEYTQQLCENYATFCLLITLKTADFYRKPQSVSTKHKKNSQAKQSSHSPLRALTQTQTHTNTHTHTHTYVCICFYGFEKNTKLFHPSIEII